MVKEAVADSLEILTLISGLFILLLLILFVFKFVFKKQTKLYDGLVHLLQDHYLFLGFLISLVATLGSLFYSDIMSFTPCKFCWYQRIFMYPQPILFLIAMRVNEKKSIVVNSMILSFIGGLIAANHYLLQLGIESSIGCDAIGFSASCSEFFSFSYGYITIPMMALTAFVLLVFIGYGRLRGMQTGRV